MAKIPRDRENDFTPEMAKRRRAFLREGRKVALPHIAAASFDYASLSGNVENAIGAAQVPIGLAGPLLVKGEHVDGEVYVPMATAEGTLVASYSRGMRLIGEAGGAKVTVLERYMQRAPVFHFENARQARDFGVWLDAHFAEVKAAAEATTSVGKLSHIEQYGVAKMRYLRMNFTTGDAAGQNMAGKAGKAACDWIIAHYGKPIRYTLSGAIDTDKKHSLLNTLHSRGARVVAELTLTRDLVRERLHVDTADLYRARQVSTMGGFMAGSTGNGLHVANGLAALFIATGQDAANVAESHACLTYTELNPDGSLYWAMTLPSLIMATFGGGTGLATQKECLAIMDCVGAGKIGRLLEITAATCLAGELSLAGAVVGGDWVEAHDRLGRNRN